MEMVLGSSRAAHVSSCPGGALLEPHIPTGSHFSLSTYGSPSLPHSNLLEAKPLLMVALMGHTSVALC